MSTLYTNPSFIEFVKSLSFRDTTLSLSNGRGGDAEIEIEYEISGADGKAVCLSVMALWERAEELRAEWQQKDPNNGPYSMESAIYMGEKDAVLQAHLDSIAELLTEWVDNNYQLDEDDDDYGPDYDCYFSYGWGSGDKADIQRLCEDFIEYAVNSLEEIEEAYDDSLEKIMADALSARGVDTSDDDQAASTLARMPSVYDAEGGSYVYAHWEGDLAVIPTGRGDDEGFFYAIERKGDEWAVYGVNLALGAREFWTSYEDIDDAIDYAEEQARELYASKA